MKATLIITCHNQNKFLEQLLCMLNLNPGVDNLLPEIIIVDSSDKPIAEAKGAKNYRIPNYGPSYARNFGASKATGEWLIFCDADDMVNPMVFKSIEQLDTAGFDAVFFNWKKEEDSIFASVANNFFKDLEFPSRFSFETLNDPLFFIGTFYPVHSLLLKRSLMDLVKFKEDQWFIEDVRFYIELALIPGVRLGKCTSKELTSFHRYFKNKSSLSTSNEEKFWEGVCNNYNYLYEYASLSFKQKITLSKLLLLSYHSVAPSVQLIIENKCERIWNSFGGLGKFLKNKSLFKFATGITRAV